MVIEQGAALPEGDLGRIRRMADELSRVPYDDEAIRQIWLANDQSVTATIATIWDEKAAASAALVDVSEGSSSRKMSQARTAAAAQATLWWGRRAAEDAVEQPVAARRTTTRPIRRV